MPSSVQWALFRAGKLPDPYAHQNSKQYTWVVEKVWYYRRNFETPPGARGQYVFLRFDGIDYFARIWLNGTLLGRHEGMFGGPEVEVSNLLRDGSRNDLVVEVKAANFGVGEAWKPELPGKVVLPWGLTGGLGLITANGHFMLHKKGPIDVEEFFPVGIWRGVRLEVFPRIHLERPFLVTESASASEARISLSAEVFANSQSLECQLHPWKEAQLTTHRNGWTAKPVTIPVSIQVQFWDGSAPGPVFTRQFPLHIYEGRNWVKQDLLIPSPKLWWPNGLGEPHLYRVKLALMEAGKAVDNLEFEYGIRKLRMLPTSGPRTLDRWDNWRFEINGRPIFAKGCNWWLTDVLLDLPRSRYEWLLGAAQAAGIQLLRINGVGFIETEDFYSVCDRLGILVWQDFPISNTDTPDFPQDVWEAQVLQIVLRLRNHPALALYCGGNEFNPYCLGNATTIGILERSLAVFDPTRPFIRTTPDPGDVHTYPNMDPTWYQHIYRWVPFISETGLWTMPEPQSVLEVVDKGEFAKPLSNIGSDEFALAHPEFTYHFMEYAFREGRIVPMLSRASQYEDMTAPSLESLSEAVQVAAGEFDGIISDSLQANYPVSVGFMPWVFNDPWPLEFFKMLDYFGQPVAPYYFLKHSYEPTHIIVRLPQLIWARGEKFPVQISVAHAPAAALPGLMTSVQIYDDHFQPRWHAEHKVDVAAGASVTNCNLGEFTIADDLQDRFFLIVAELKRSTGELVSRSVYWPRCLKLMEDADFRKKYRESPQPSLHFDHGPWLREQVATQPTSLQLVAVSVKERTATRGHVEVRVRNTGRVPSFMTHLDIAGTQRAFYATDNYFWLAPGEERTLGMEVLWRNPATRNNATITVAAWNAPAKQVSIPPR